jgi:hypothetical protein
VLTWIVVVSFTINPALEYDGDVFLGVLAFYLMLGYLIGAGKQPFQSWLGWLVGGPRQASLGANLALRLFQVHFAILIVTSALHKLQFGDWWSGVALWYPLVPPMETTLAQARAITTMQPENFLFFLSIATYSVLIWQLLFPLYAWRTGWRWLLVGGAVVGWLGTAFLYQLPLIGPAVLIGCLAYLSPAEWRAWLARLGQIARAVLGVFRRSGAAPQPAAGKALDTVEVGQAG